MGGQAAAPVSEAAVRPAPSAAGSLRIGELDDAYEREADRIADALMSGAGAGAPDPPPPFSLSSLTVAPPTVQRCACGCSDEPDGSCVQRKPTGAATTSPAGYAPPAVHNVVGSGGRPLDPAVRDFFEPRLRHDLGGVRVHTDTVAAQSAEAVGARAYTVGRHLVFGRGEWSPSSAAGRRLLAHELVHTIQQGDRGAPASVQRNTLNYDQMTVAQLRRLAATDRAALDALDRRFRAMSDGELGRYTSDPLAQSIMAARTVVHPDAQGQGRFSRAGVQTQLEQDIATARGAWRASSGRVRPPRIAGIGDALENQAGTMGSARTDIPGLENINILGRSPRAGGGYNPNSSFAPPTDVWEQPQTHAHAEQNIGDQLEAILRSVPREQLRGRTVWMLIEQEPCSTCAQGIADPTQRAGVLRRIAERFPELTFEIKNSESSALIVLRGSTQTVSGAAASTPGQATQGQPGGGAATPARVGTQIRVLSSTRGADGTNVSEIEYSFGENLEAINRNAPSGGRMPARMVVRVTQAADGTITHVESVSGEPHALADAIVRRTLPEALAGEAGGAAEGAAEGTGLAARALPYARTGLHWGGWIAFTVITGYQLLTAAPGQEGRVAATAAGGLAGGVLSSYLVCNVLLDLETAGWGILICGVIAGGVGGSVAAGRAGEAYDEANPDPLRVQLGRLASQNTNVQNLFNLLLATRPQLSVTADFVRRYLETVPRDLTDGEVILLAGEVASAGNPPPAPRSPDGRSHATPPGLGPSHTTPQGFPSVQEQQGTVCPNCHDTHIGPPPPGHLGSLAGALLRPDPAAELLTALRTAVGGLPRNYRAPGDISHHTQATPTQPPPPNTQARTSGQQFPTVREQQGTVCPSCHRANGEDQTRSVLRGQLGPPTDADRRAIQNYLNATPRQAQQQPGVHATPPGLGPSHTTPQGFPSVQEQQGTVCPNCHRSNDPGPSHLGSQPLTNEEARHMMELFYPSR